ncbi:MAG: DUF116 domain-containing protein [Phycisphaeraceae bacterium]
MQLPLTTLPVIAPQRPERPPQANVPPTRGEREYLHRLIASYVAKEKPVPPMPLQELRVRADDIIRTADIAPVFREYIAILINNEAWKEHLAPVPFERRLLLLPKCLRDEERCPAPFDEFGLLCKQCGLCSIQDLQNEAERLGYAVLTAEGSAIVTAIIETGKIDAIVGVSCLSVLEKAFPYMEAAAIPGVAIPLLQDDCKDTNLDIEWLWDMIHLTSEDQTRRLDLDTLRDEVDSWFTLESLERIMGRATSHPEQVSRQWLSRAGKRWRPFLAVCMWKAMQGEKGQGPGAKGQGEHQPENPQSAIRNPTSPGPWPLALGPTFPLGLMKLAVAVECFHKASLIHDDIEDNDDVRYDEPTLHAELGIPIALNVGDLMLGEGYRLIAECGSEAPAIVQMLKVASEGHRQLSIGQGQELKWLRDPSPLEPSQVIDIFRRKTAPAFEVALKLGALYAWKEEPETGDRGQETGNNPQSAIPDPQSLDDLLDTMHDYSEALGIAYQVKDDLDDFEGSIDSNDTEAMRLSICLAIAHERAKRDNKALLASLWAKDAAPDAAALAQVKTICDEVEASTHARQLHDVYKEQAIRSLRSLENASVKGLLRRVMTKIFDDLKIEGWCRDDETGNAAGSEAVAEAAQ